MRAAWALCALALAGCATGAQAPSAPIAPVIVHDKTPVPCVVREPALAPYPDTDAALKAAGDIFGRVRLLMAGRALRSANEAALRAAAAGCGQ